jgi:hypothetical protein
MSVHVPREKIAFAEKAAKFFADHPKYSTYGDIKRGEYFAMRSGLADDCVEVFEIGDDPVKFVQFIDKHPEPAPE